MVDGVNWSFEAPPDFERHNRGLTPSFFQIREPLFDENGKPRIDATGKHAEYVTEVCKICIAGDLQSEAIVPAKDGTPMSPHVRFAAAYKAWQEGVASASGTLLADWGEASLNDRVIHELNELHISTVENLAAVSDVHLARLINGRTLRDKAVKWLADHPSREEGREIHKLKLENEILLTRMAKLEAMVSRPARRGRPKKPKHGTVTPSEADTHA